MGLEEQKQRRQRAPIWSSALTSLHRICRCSSRLILLPPSGPSDRTVHHGNGYGAVDNFYPHEALRVFVQMMLDGPVPGEYRTMIYNNPRKLLNFED
jgi:hypothetical protein